MSVVRLVTIALALFIWTQPVPAGAEMPGPDAEALWNYITRESPYTEWGQWPDWQGMKPSRSPHGPQAKVFVNSPGLGTEKPPLAYGTIEVKESYADDDETLKNITVQYKVKGFNPQGGDWYWAHYSPQGRVRSAGKVKGCLSCHGFAKKNDYVMAHKFK
jgi:hypothetical protein